jgi:hypothetical protein
MEMIAGKNSQEPQGSSTVNLMHAVNFQPMKENEDVHLYLYNFEKTAELNGWPRENWVTKIQPLLNYKAQIAYKALPMHYSKDFERLKQAIFEKFQLSPEHFQRKFRSERKRDNETYKEYGYKLKDVFKMARVRKL